MSVVGDQGAAVSDGVEPDSIHWLVDRGPDGVTSVTFYGVIDEFVDFASLTPLLRGRVVFELGGVQRVNSCGLRQWVNFVCDLPGVSSLTYAHCSPAVVEQLNMVYNFRGRERAWANVRSILLPFTCDTCGQEVQTTMEIARFSVEDSSELPTSPGCPSCSTSMNLSELPAQYLSFLRDG